MDKTFHRFSELFAQLGLPADEDGIREFLVTHSPLPADVMLVDAPFWSSAQATLLREEILEDADWAEVVDQLDAALRSADCKHQFFTECGAACDAVLRSAGGPPQMQPIPANPQNDFLNTARKERKRVEVYLVNGIKLTGSIASFDQFVVMLSGPGGTQIVYKSAVSTIQVPTGVRQPGSGTRSEARTSFGSEPKEGVVVTRKRRFTGPDGGSE